MAVFEKPERKNSKLRIGIQGLSFAGKTYTALTIGTGLVGPGGRIALVDCEGGESELYADEFDFDRIVMQPPYTPERFIEYIEAAKDEGYDVVILDTISNEWDGEGGLLEDRSEIEKNSKNKLASFSAWSEITPRHNRFLGAMIHAGIHVIATIRSKQAYAIDVVNGVNKPVKIALGPIQRENIVYEFSIYLEMDDSHTATVKKDRTRVIGDMGTVFSPDEETGAALRRWLDGDDSVETVPIIKKPEPPKKINLFNQQQVDSIRQTYKENGWNESIFEIANLRDGTYNADKINADYKQREELRRKKAENPISSRGSTTSTSKKDVAEVTTSKPQTPETTNHVSTADNDPEVVTTAHYCESCGAEITKSQAETTRLFFGKSVCKTCQKAGGKKLGVSE